MTTFRTTALVILLTGLTVASPKDDDLKANLAKGAVQLESIGPLAFGPEHILFVSDPIAAMIYAIDVSTQKGKTIPRDGSIDEIDSKVAAMLGVPVADANIIDLAADPGAGLAYLSVRRGQGDAAQGVIAVIGADGEMDALDLSNVAFSKVEIKNAPTRGEATDRRGRSSNPRAQSITDIAYVEGQVIIAGLSNEEFASKLRIIPYPFVRTSDGTSVEIFHGAHGRFETNSPIRTFVPFDLGVEPQVLAAYTCTPLVRFPLSDLTPGAKIRGTTIAELGNRNTPLDMIAYERDGRNYLLVANTSRGVMKVSLEGMEKIEGITRRVEGDGTAGAPYDTLSDLQGVEQLDRLDESRAVVLVRGAEGRLALRVIPLP